MFQTRVSNFSDNASLGRFLFPFEKLFFFVSASFCRRFDLDTLLSTELRTSMRNKSSWLACTRFLSTFRRSLSNSTRKYSSSLRFAKRLSFDLFYLYIRIRLDPLQARRKNETFYDNWQRRTRPYQRTHRLAINVSNSLLLENDRNVRVRVLARGRPVHV